MLSLEGKAVGVDVRLCTIWGEASTDDLIRLPDGRFARGRWSQREQKYTVNRANNYELWEITREGVIAWCNSRNMAYPDFSFMPMPATEPIPPVVISEPHDELSETAERLLAALVDIEGKGRHKQITIRTLVHSDRSFGNESSKHIQNALSQLRQRQLITSKRGPQGGVRSTAAGKASVARNSR
jgi:hypothetical protein